MVPPIELTFRHLRPLPWMEPELRRRVERLAVFRDNIVSGHVLVAMPHRHHRGGNRFHVSITLQTPGGELAVTREANLRAISADLAARKWSKALEIESVQKDLRFVIRKAFDSARRRLQDQVRRQRGAVKAHVPRQRGRKRRQAA